jgi:hypothetical protein
MKLFQDLGEGDKENDGGDEFNSTTIVKSK